MSFCTGKNSLMCQVSHLYRFPFQIALITRSLSLYLHVCVCVCAFHSSSFAGVHFYIWTQLAVPFLWHTVYLFCSPPSKTWHGAQMSRGCLLFLCRHLAAGFFVFPCLCFSHSLCMFLCLCLHVRIPLLCASPFLLSAFTPFKKCLSLLCQIPVS